MFAPFSRSAILKGAIKKIAEARNSDGSRAEQCYKSAYQGFAKVVAGDIATAEALHNWGFGLLHEARTKDQNNAAALYLDAINKFTFCLLVAPNHLGGAIDGGVAYMELARLNETAIDDELYDKALDFFLKAEQIQKGSASYNLACIYALRSELDTCLQFLEQARESGSLPDEQDVMDDPDLASIKNAHWFQEFLGSVQLTHVEQAENDRRTRRGLKEADEIKLNLPPRPTDSTLRRHYDAMVNAELEKQQELAEQQKQAALEKAKKKKTDEFDYYK